MFGFKGGKYGPLIFAFRPFSEGFWGARRGHIGAYCLYELLQNFFLHTAVMHFEGIAFGGANRFTRVLRMSLKFISACSWLLHDNKSGCSYVYM